MATDAVPAGQGTPDPLLQARGLRKRYGTTEVVAGLDFEVCRGEVVGFLGPNGAGKTTTVCMLYGAVLPTSGEILLGSLRIPARGREARRFMGIVSQDDNLDPEFTAEENLVHFAHHYGIRGAAARHRADELLHRVGLDAYRRFRIDELSGGLKRRLVLARALLNMPRLVFLDEPTTGLDPDSRQGFWRLVMELREAGCGIILTTHYMDEAQRLCDRLFLLQRGRIIDQGAPQDLIMRTVGRDVLEVEGLPESTVAQFAAAMGTWFREFGAGHIVALPGPGPHRFLDRLEQSGASRVSIRQANLEDVFLRLTGDRLD